MTHDLLKKRRSLAEDEIKEELNNDDQGTDGREMNVVKPNSDLDQEVNCNL